MLDSLFRAFNRAVFKFTHEQSGDSTSLVSRPVGGGTFQQGHYFVDLYAADLPRGGLALVVKSAQRAGAENLIHPQFHAIGRGHFRSFLGLVEPAAELRTQLAGGTGDVSAAQMTISRVPRIHWYLLLIQTARRSRRLMGHGVRDDLAAAWTLFRRAGPAALASRLRRAASSSGAQAFGAPTVTIPVSSAGEGLFSRLYWRASSIAEGYRHPDYAADKRTITDATRSDIKVVTYYLPQFHPFAENERWWGKGFTEWTNVTKAVPRFIGHYQPRLPSDLGFYDLRVADTIRRQAEMARRYGISAFCFHFYWFGGKRLMEEPLQLFLDNPDIDIEFCLCWANENWTRRWDGAEQDILIGQSHSPEDDRAFLTHISRYFRDRRYLRIDGRPVLLVYRTGILPDPAATIARWREVAAELGFPGIYVVATTSFGFSDYEKFGFDALAEFPPHNILSEDMTAGVEFVDPRFSGIVFSYEATVRREKSRNDHPKGIVFPGAMPSWDNTARRPTASHVFHGSTPLLYREWLDASFKRAKNNPSGEQFVFVNAWNEWAEGAHLEPDRIYGHAYLWATASVVEDHSKKARFPDRLLDRHNAKFVRKSKYAVIAHIFYPDVVDEFVASIDCAEAIDIYVTIPDSFTEAEFAQVASALPGSFMLRLPNIGRDILPFLTVLRQMPLDEYEWICKVHSKKSLHMRGGDEWRRQAFAGLLGAIHDGVPAPTDLFNDKTVGIIALSGSVASLNDEWTRANTESLLFQYGRKLGITPDWGREQFVAGTMFWFRPEALAPLLTLSLTEADFGPELGRIDGTLAHAIERLIGIVARESRFRIAETPLARLDVRTHRTAGTLDN